MSQYINLFNPTLQKRRDAFSARVLPFVTAATVVIMIAAAIAMRHQTEDLERQASDGAAQLKQDQDKLVALAKGATERKPDGKLADELARAEAMLKARGDLIQLVESGALGKTDGFSEQLRAFARQSMNGLWLTGFNITSGGKEMAIDGKALNAELLPTYIRRLNAEQVFHGKSFATLNMDRVQETPQQGGQSAAPTLVGQRPPQVAFSLSSKLKEQ